MPKMKTHKGAAKRFKTTGSGKLKRNRAYHGHLFTKKNAKRKRRLNQPDMVAQNDEKRMKKLLPYG